MFDTLLLIPLFSFAAVLVVFGSFVFELKKEDSSSRRDRRQPRIRFASP